MFTVESFRVGQRIQIHPATDLWMRGLRFGTIERIGRKNVGVRLDNAPGQVVTVAPRNIGEIL